MMHSNDGKAHMVGEHLSKEDRDGEPLRSLYADDDLIADILPAFVTNLPKYLDSLKVAVEGSDLVAAARTCHDLKGTAGGYGYPQIGALAEELEKEIKGSQHIATIARLLQDLTRLCYRAKLGLKH